MTLLWRAAEALAIAVAVLLGGAAAAFGAAWVLSRAARRWGIDPTPMGSTVEKFPKVSARESEAIRAQADARRERAQERHTEGHQIDSGQPPPEDRAFKVVGRR